MDRIQFCVDTLIGAIREGETYQRYMECEKKLKEQPDLRKQIDEFRVATYHFNNEDTGEDLFEKIDQFEGKFYELRKNPIVNEYLEAELDVCKLLQKVANRIQGGIELQIPRV